MKRKVPIILLFACVLQSCTHQPTAPEYQKKISIFAFLWGNEPLDERHAVAVTFTQPITEYYDITRAAIADARVTLTDESSGESFLLTNQPENPAYFFNKNVVIKYSTTYSLKVEAEGQIVTARTQVPPPLKITTTLKQDSINYVYPKNLGYQHPIYLQCEKVDQIILVDLFCNERYDQAEYIYSAQESRKYPSNQEEYQGGSHGEPQHLFVFTKFSELAAADFNYQHVIFWYDAMIVFYGSYTLMVLAIDENYHSFLYREHPELNGGVQGGIGLFAAVCGAKFPLQVLK